MAALLLNVGWLREKNSPHEQPDSGRITRDVNTAASADCKWNPGVGRSMAECYYDYQPVVRGSY
jgi:hypothetical protein